MRPFKCTLALTPLAWGQLACVTSTVWRLASMMFWYNFDPHQHMLLFPLCTLHCACCVFLAANGYASACIARAMLLVSRIRTASGHLYLRFNVTRTCLDMRPTARVWLLVLPACNICFLSSAVLCPNSAVPDPLCIYYSTCAVWAPNSMWS